MACLWSSISRGSRVTQQESGFLRSSILIHHPWKGTNSVSRTVRSSLVSVALTTGLACGSFAADFEPLVPEPIWISGRVVDRHDRPVRYASVSANPQSVGGALRSALGAANRDITDADGWFNIAVPSVGVRYSVTVENMGWSLEWPSAIPGRGGPITVQLADAVPARSIGGTVVDGAERPVSNASVRFVVENGVSDEVVTDTGSRFVFDGIPECLGEISLIARVNGLVGTTHAERQNHKLQLRKPGGIKGSVLTKNSGVPIAGAAVIIRACFLKGLRMRTTSDKNGMFEFSELPDGVYVVQAESDAYFDNPKGFLQVPVREDEVATTYLEMEPVATLLGCVTDRKGRPIARAFVGTMSSWLGEPWEQYRYVQTDEDGEFSIGTGHTKESLQVEVFSARGGSVSLSVDPLSPGAVARLTVRLPGVISLRGVVVDPSGRPIPDICCRAPSGATWLSDGGVSDKTDATGRFDFGLISIGFQGGEPSVTFLGPRPYGSWRWDFQDKSRFPPDQPAAGPYYQFKRVEYDSTPDRNVELKVTLEPAQVLTFRGRVFDRDHHPVAGAPVHLFAGIPINWHETVHPQRSSGGIGHDLRLSSTKTSTDGKWLFQVVRETAESMRIAYGGSDDPKAFSVVVETPDGGDVNAMQHITVPEHGSEVQVDLALDIVASTSQPDRNSSPSTR